MCVCRNKRRTRLIPLDFCVASFSLRFHQALAVQTPLDALTLAAAVYEAGADAAALRATLDSQAIAPAPAMPEVALSTQVYWLMHRQWVLLRRSPSLTVGRILPTAIFSVIVGSLFYQIGSSQNDARTRVGALFFAVAQLVFSAFALVNTVFLQRPIYYVQKNNQYFRAPLFPITFFLADLPLTLLNCLVYCLIVYSMVGLRDGIGSVSFLFFFIMSIVMSTAGRYAPVCVASLSLTRCYVLFSQISLPLVPRVVAFRSAWAFFLASAIPIEAAASVVAPVTTVLFFLFAGYIIPRASIAIGWKWFHYASFLTYPFRGAWCCFLCYLLLRLHFSLNLCYFT